MYHDGTTRELGATFVSLFLRELSDAQATSVRLVEIFHPLEALRRVEIVDTPGLNSIRPEHEKVARDFLVDADALVWVFAIGQAAKASEKEALALAHGAGKHVLGVLNKIDGVTEDDVRAVVRHVQGGVGSLVLRRSSPSRRRARSLRAAPGRSTARPAALEAALSSAASSVTRAPSSAPRRDSRRFRALRRGGARRQRSSLGARRTSPPAAARRSTPSTSGFRRRPGTRACRAARPDRRGLPRRRLRGAGLRAAPGLAVRRAPRRLGRPVASVPRRSCSGTRSERATETTRAALCETLAATPGGAADGAARAIDTAIARFGAYAHGVVEGSAVAEFFPLGSAAHRGSTRWRSATRSPGARLATPSARSSRRWPVSWPRSSDAEHAALDDEEAVTNIRHLLHEERLERPLEALEAALVQLR